jgi:hypothetical protein
MSLETDELNQPNDGDDAGGRHRFGFRHADTGIDEDGVNRDVDDDAADDGEVDADAVNTGTVYDSTDDADVVDTDDPQPTFTPADSDAATTVPADGQVVAGQVVEGEVVEGEVVEDDVTVPNSEYDTSTSGYDTSTLNDANTFPDATAVNDAVPASTTTAPPVAAFDGNAPLLGDSVNLRASWQQAAAEFVDDPRAAVAEAADLVEQTTQTLVGALQQRQQQLRGQWENGTATGVNGANGTAAETGDTVDTEELRHMMQSYRALFNQLTAL